MKFYDSFKSFATTLNVQYRLKLRNIVFKIKNGCEKYLEWNSKKTISYNEELDRNNYKYTFDYFGNPNFMVPSNLPITINGNEMRSSGDILNKEKSEEVVLIEVEDNTSKMPPTNSHWIKNFFTYENDFDRQRINELKINALENKNLFNNKDLKDILNLMKDYDGDGTPIFDAGSDVNEFKEELNHALSQPSFHNSEPSNKTFAPSADAVIEYELLEKEKIEIEKFLNKIISPKIAAKKKPKKRTTPTTAKKKSNRKAKK